MKAAQINKYGTDVVEINEVSEPEVSSGNVIIEVHASGINPFDWKLREGFFKNLMPLKFPFTLGGDFSGLIKKVGVLDFKEGDEVYGTASALGSGSGSFAEIASADVKFIAKKPGNISHIESAGLPLAGVSALQSLYEHIKLKKRQKILIHGGAGGIGGFAIQIAKHLGAYVASTSGSDDLEFVKKLGADEAIDYKKQRFEELLKDYDAVFDTVGGETYKKSFKVLKKNGIIVSMLEQPDKKLIKEYGVKSMAQMTEVNNERLNKLAELVNLGVIKVHVDKTFPLEETRNALEHVRIGHPRGKVVLKIKK